MTKHKSYKENFREEQSKTAVDKRQDQQIKKIIREYQPELKTAFIQFPVNAIVASTTNTPRFGVFNAIAQGDGQNQRTGDKIRIKKITFKMILEADAQTTFNNWVRVMILKDSGYDGLPPDYTQIIDGSSILNGDNSNAVANYDVNYVNVLGSKGKRYTVYYDKVVYFGKIDTTATQSWSNGTINRTLTFKKTFKSGIPVYFDGAAAGNARENSVIVAVFPGNDLTAASNPEWYYRSQVYYTDV